MVYIPPGYTLGGENDAQSGPQPPYKEERMMRRVVLNLPRKKEGMMRRVVLFLLRKREGMMRRVVLFP